MIVNSEIAKRVYSNVSTAKLQKAREYVEQNRVKVYRFIYNDNKNFEISGKTKDIEKYASNLRIEDGKIASFKCDCSDYERNRSICKHIAATLLEFEKNPEYSKRILGTDIGKNVIEKKAEAIVKNTENIERYSYAKRLIKNVYNDVISKSDMVSNKRLYNNVHIVPILSYDRYYKRLSVYFKIGTTKLYKIRYLVNFYNSMKEKENYKYGDKLEFVHEIEAFDEEAKQVLPFIMKYAEIIKYASNILNYRHNGGNIGTANISLDGSSLDELFEIYKGKTLELESYRGELPYLTFIDEEPKLEFKLEKINDNDYELIAEEEFKNYTILDGDKYIYLYGHGKIYKASKALRDGPLEILEYINEGNKKCILNKEDVPLFFSVVAPKIKEYISDDCLEGNMQDYIPKDLGVKVYLDFDKRGNVIADVKFCYDEIEFNPYEDNRTDIARNIAQEVEVNNLFKNTGFVTEKLDSKLILRNDDKIYEFLTNGINEYMQRFEVLVTDEFKTKQVRTPRISKLGISINNDLLNINLSGLDFDKEELKTVMSKYTLKKKYYRLKDGTFLNLEDSKELEFLDNLATGLNLEYSEIGSEDIKIPVYRSIYLEKILDNIKNTEVEKDKSYRNIVNNIENKGEDIDYKLPAKLEDIMRYYQKTGYKWLRVLDNYKFGGILADDMGLGKTLQLLSVILAYVQETKKQDRKPTIVVCPSSLTLNWRNESTKFSAKLKTIVVSGKANEREDIIKQLSNYDLVITSYDSLKRDIDVYKDNNIKFRYIIADEAQYIKNSNTQNSKALKDLEGETRYALTGTPIENSLSELWSIFDYIMPGYLYSYSKFKRLFETPIIKDEDEIAVRKLRFMIEPFILRRLKKDVLSELPDKTITVLSNEMTNEQKEIYASYMIQTKETIFNEIKENGFERSQIKILALLTRLRQICCHPSLFIDNYDGESSKLNQCIELIQEAKESGHKMLLFSQFTSMFEILERKLKENNIKYFKLTGETKVDERIKLVDEFNDNEDISVFLISLKAGGTGLNLTGADIVIHYDPWWNASSENQATDRAYRIGQKNNVQVYKLITQDSIEEKIYELQEKKSKLIDNMLSTEETFINKLSKEDILALFD